MASNLLDWSKEADKYIESPMDIRRRRDAEAQAQALEKTKVESEAFYKQQLGLSEKAKREGAGQADARLQQAIAGAPNMQEYVPPGTTDPQAIKDGMSRWNAANQSYWMSNYPEYADDMTKGADRLRQQVQAPDPSTVQAKTEAEAQKAGAEAEYYAAGGPEARMPIEVSDAELQVVRGVLQEGKGYWGKKMGESPTTMNSIALEAKAIQSRERRAGLPPRPYIEYVRQARDLLYGAPGQAPATAPAPAGTPAPSAGQAGGAAPQRRVVDLRNR